MAKEKSNALRHGILDRFVQNTDGLELKDSGGTVIARATGVTWENAGATEQGAVFADSGQNITGLSAAGGGTDAETARLYDDSGSSGEEATGLIVGQDQNVTVWSSGTTYSTGDRVTNDLAGVTFHFVAIQGHTADAQKEPGAGETWPAYWDLVDVVLDNANIADGQSISINQLAIVEPRLLQ